MMEDAQSRRQNMPTIGAVGIPWFGLEDWKAFKLMCSDADQLHDNHKDWLRDAKRMEKLLQKEGLIVERVLIDPNAFSAWCALRGMSLDGKARAAFAAEAVKSKYQKRG
jgi:hypothetical protein